ncbi:MAG TPA: esterase [Balneolaceae bacterium]|nr:esterase [Balneolaceae bacterium]|tara:strand:- start:129330 stop:129761 length:432 start_codon:yes stop_codon:yes gene_type:complete
MIEIEETIREKVEWFLDNQSENMATKMGVKFLKISRDEMIAEMPVDDRTVQPFRILHGGASVALAETLCSVGGWLNIPESKTAVGVEINANHHRSVREGGKVTAVATPLQIGRTMQVWETKINDERGKLVCSSRCTLAIIDKR